MYAALNRAKLMPESLDLILAATATPDMIFPSVACLVQTKLGAKHAAAFEYEAGMFEKIILPWLKTMGILLSPPEAH